jgi:hypothetical protein
LIARIRRAPKAPLSVAGILATPLFFAALMAFSLRLDELTVHGPGSGAEVLGDPAKPTVGLIYLAFRVCASSPGIVGCSCPRPSASTSRRFRPSSSRSSSGSRSMLGGEYTAAIRRRDLIQRDPGDLFLRGSGRRMRAGPQSSSI